MNFTLAKFCIRLLKRVGKMKERLYVKVLTRNIISKKLNKTENCNYFNDYLLNFDVLLFVRIIHYIYTVLSIMMNK